MNSTRENRLVKETISFPVRYDSKQQTIWDSNDMMVCDIKGWGRIQYMNRNEERQDAIGEKVAKLLNEFSTQDSENDLDEEVGENIFSQKRGNEFFEWH